jgi:hypothetical protein
MLCKRLPNFAWLLRYNTSQTCHKHNSFSENVQGNRKPLCSFSNSLLSKISQLTSCMLVLLRLSPFVKQTSHLQEKPMYHILQTNEHLHTAGHRYKQENLTLYGKEECQPSTHIAWKVHVWQHFEFLTNKPLHAFQTKSKTLPFLFHINRPTARWPVYLLIFLIS